MNRCIAGKTVSEWIKTHPLLKQIMTMEEVTWFTPSPASVATALPALDITAEDIRDASQRLSRFAPYIRRVFPETEETGGIIESPLRRIPVMQKALAERYDTDLPGQLMLKCDSHLPISGSIKARGGIYEVLKCAETLAVSHGMLSIGDDYAMLADERFTQFFSRFSIAVGSTGNLGLSIGIMGACLGFKVTVHMSADARTWKKEMLRAKGVRVIEYAEDYSNAVEEGRKQAQADPSCHFVDDENSKDLFMGYAVAAERLKRQLDEMSITVDDAHPLFVYLPCGVGGGPGGVAFGLKTIFGDAVHCFFAEPTHCPSMLMGLYTEKHDAVCVQDFGIDNLTAADGLACGRPSGFVGKRMAPLMDGAFTTTDDEMYRLLALLADKEKIFLEPSALAGMPGILRISKATDYLNRTALSKAMKNAVHIAWATGGSMVPDDEINAYCARGASLL